MEALVNNMIKATGWSIFHSLWQGALLYGMLVLLFVMIPTLSAKAKHNMAYGTMCLLFVGFCGTFFSLFTWPPLSSVTTSLSFHNQHALNYKAEQFFPQLVGLYTVGLIMQVLILSTGYFKILSLKHSSKIAVPQAWNALFQELAQGLNITKKVGFYLSEHVAVPLVIGFIKPIILFPVAFANQLDLAHVEAILIHELSHIRRNDYLLNIVKTVMETILFFNPFTWLCSNLIAREREHSCDDLVVQHTHTPLTYAHALLQIELLKEKQTPVFSMAASGNNQHLYQRIKRITNMKTTYSTAKQQLFAIGITMAIIISLAWVSPLKSETGDKKKTATSTMVAMESRITNDVFQQDSTKNKKHKADVKKSKALKKNIAPPPPPVEPSIAPPAPPVEPPALTEPPALPAPPSKPDAAAMAQYREEIKKHFNSPAWKKQIEDVKVQSKALAKHFNSPEWKKQQAELSKMTVEMKKQFNSPAFKKQMEDVKIQSQALAQHYNSPAFKKQMEDVKFQSQAMAKHFNSPAFKKQMELNVEVCTELNEKEIEAQIEKELKNIKINPPKETEKNK
ncbi:M56 family metallopeptidase [Pedobacter sp.]|uniref:M56 family metallopeptidase n=1 Tax=Pedobacter sp. TaxID=1411316 RepID=UPI003D7FB838